MQFTASAKCHAGDAFVTMLSEEVLSDDIKDSVLRISNTELSLDTFPFSFVISNF